MSNYQNGKIYTIRCREDPTLIYVGSTIQPLSKRWGGHKIDSKRKEHLLLYQSINNEWDKWYIELYELYPCLNKEELRKREGEITRIIGNLNMLFAGRTQKEYDYFRYNNNKEQERERSKQYKINNIDKVKEYKKDYLEKNNEKIKEKKQEWYEKQKQKEDYEIIKQKKKEYNKEWREKNKEVIKQKKKEYYEKLKKQLL